MTSDRFTSTLSHNTYLPTGIVVNGYVMLLTDFIDFKNITPPACLRKADRVFISLSY
jgi:hypothetical protein